MIPADIIKKIRRIHIKGSRTVNTIMAGQYKSVFRGSGIEFEEVREYSPGDDIKSIDWKVSARLGRPFIKLYREERESIVMLLIDMSSSLKFGTFSGMKLEKAAEAASVLAFSAIRNNDKVGAIFFTDRVEKYIPPKKVLVTYGGLLLRYLHLSLKERALISQQHLTFYPLFQEKRAYLL